MVSFLFVSCHGYAFRWRWSACPGGGVLEGSYADGGIGPQYTADNVFGLSTMQPYGVGQLYDDFTAVTKDVVLYLPRSSDLNELAVYARKHHKESGKKMEVAHYCIRGVSKALCAYFGRFEFT